MLRVLYLAPDGHIVSDLGSDQYETALQETNNMLWVDFVGEPEKTCERIMLDIFKFHPLAVEEALQEIHIPKVDEWDSYIYVALHSIALDKWEEGYIRSLELDMFVGRNYLVTYHKERVPEIDKIWGASQIDERHLKKGSSNLLYRLADELVAGYMQVTDKVEDDLEEIEDQIFDNPSQQILAQLFTLKRILLHLRRIITPQRDAINNLSRNEYSVIDPQYRIFYRSVYDHLVRLTDIGESMRDLVSSALSSYLSVINNRLNDVMKTLTIITTLFMPISFLTGFFGMNFFQPVFNSRVWTGAIAFLIVLSVVIALPAMMLIWIKKQRWM